MPNRCEFGCSPRVKPMHRFPCFKMFPERFKTWVTLVGGKLESESDWEVYRKKFICDRHFVKEDKTRRNWLNALAVPTLHVPGYVDNQINLQEEVEATACVSTGGVTTSQSILDAPSTSTQHLQTTIYGPAYSGGVTTSQSILDAPSTSTQHSQTTIYGPAYSGGVTTSQSILDAPSTSTQHSQTTIYGPAYSGGVTTSQSILDAPSTSTQHSQTTIYGPAYSGGVTTSQSILDAPSTSTQHSQTTIYGPACSGEVVTSQSLLDVPSTSTRYSLTTTSGPAYSESTTRVVAGHRVVLEHNYSVISKPRKSSNKDGFSRKVAYQTVQPLHTKIKNLRSEISRLRKKGQKFKSRLANAEKLTENMSFQTVMKNLKKPAQLFLCMQQQAKKTPKGRRFTIQEKILSLSLYKKSPKCYALLQKYFTLPSAKAMKRLLSEIKLSEGINPIIFNKIKETVRRTNVEDRLCTLIFDEMSITPQIFYNSSKDVLEGFASNQNTFADHVLVFMVKGVKRNFKQPVAYYFTSGLKKNDLKNIIKTVATNIQNAGLIIVATVCDQGATNVGAITELINESKATFLRDRREWRHDVIRLNGQDIIPIFDVPHLIKGIRNNLITKNMKYTMKNEEKVVKWEHYQKLYAADKSYGELRLLDKLTEEHINPEKINKMKVKTATQLFSHSVAVVAEHLTARGDLPQECRALIDITLLLDNLFDSLNVSSFHIPNGRIYKGPVKRNSPHHQLWKDAKMILKSIKFSTIKSSDNQVRKIEMSVPSVQNFIKTIAGMEAIFKVLVEKYHFDAVMTRNFNQDPVENFFGNIRSYGARNNAPNTLAFEGAFKALLLNNYSTPQSSRANCEEDTNKCLQTLEFFITEKPKTSDVPMEIDPEIYINEDIFSAVNNIHVADAGQKNYVCGWVLTKCLKNVIKSCKVCRNKLLDTANKNNSFIKAKEYSNKKWLCYPSKPLENSFHDLQMITTNFLKTNTPKKNIKKNIITIADIFVQFPFECQIHKEELKKYFLNVTINVILHSWTRSINRILAGKIKYDGEDETKLAAQSYYNRHKHYKNRK